MSPLGLASSFLALLPYLHRFRVSLIISALLSLLSTATTLLQPILARFALGDVSTSQPAWRLVLAMAGLAILNAMLSGLRAYLLQRSGVGLVRSVRRRLIAHMLRLHVREYEQRQTGDLVSRVVSDAYAMHGLITSGLTEIVSGLLVVIGALTILVWLDPTMFVFTTLGFCGLFTGTYVSVRVRKASWQVQEQLGGLSAAAQRAILAVRTIKASRAEARETEAVSGHVDRTYDAEIQLAGVHARIGPIVNGALQLGLLIVLGAGSIRLAAGAISVGDLAAILMLVFLSMGPISQSMAAFAALQAGIGAQQRVDEILSLAAETSQDTLDQNLAPSPQGVSVEFDRVTFAYPAGNTVLDDISFVFPQGTTTALVGPSGAGKTTVLTLLERFYDAQSGRILVDGHDIRDLPRDVLRAKLGYLEQDAQVLAGTVRENLLLAAPSSTEAQMFAVLELVRLDERFARSVLGLDTQVGEGGVLLSGGERQRVAMARVLLAAPPVMLLDEPTNNLDSHNESALHNAIEKLSKSRRHTIVIVAHRLATVVNADQIIVLNQGRLVAAGPHDGLVKTSALYRELVRYQLLDS